MALADPLVGILMGSQAVAYAGEGGDGPGD